MWICGSYDFNGGEKFILQKYPHLLLEVEDIINSIDASRCLTKESEEKTMFGKMLYSPRELNESFKQAFEALSWTKHKEYCSYPTKYYKNGYVKKDERRIRRPYREMDFVKEKLGVEVQFGKYAFMVYNVCGKMTIFKNLGIIDAGIEIVPIKDFADQMSTGVSYFEQFVWDLEKRGISNIDIPVLILGINK